MGIKVGFQGKHGTFSEMAVQGYFQNKPIEPVSYKDFISLFQDVSIGLIDYAMVPVENTTTGLISRTYDLFLKYPAYVVGEYCEVIRQNLLVIPGTKTEELKTVYSHPEALSQCAGFLDRHGITAVSYQDTAKAAEYVSETGDPSIAAIGSELAAKYYGLESLGCINDSFTNITRFLCISRRETNPADADKVSLVVWLAHKPGSLYNALGILAKHGINLLKLESRPILNKPFTYVFYIDFDGNLETEDTRSAMQELKEYCEKMWILGNYRAAVKGDWYHE